MSGSVRDVMAEVGFVLLYWGYLEAELDLSEPLPRDIERDLEAARAVRNLLAHGLRGAVGAPDPSDAFVRCVDRRGAERLVTVSELRALSQTIDQIRLRIRALRA